MTIPLLHVSSLAGPLVIHWLGVTHTTNLTGGWQFDWNLSHRERDRERLFKEGARSCYDKVFPTHPPSSCLSSPLRNLIVFRVAERRIGGHYIILKTGIVGSNNFANGIYGENTPR